MAMRASKKSQRREQLVVALLQQSSLEKAAASVGISPVTAWRISKTPEFQQEYLQARRQAFSQAMSRLQQAAGAAVSTLLKIMVDPNVPAASRIRAAECALHHAAESFELEDLDVRLDRLEKTHGEK
jgi:hypothetical protein